MKKLRVELFGMARNLVQAKEVDIEVGDTGTFRDVAANLAATYPALLGHVVVPETHDLIEPYFFNVEARRVVRNLDEIPEEGKPLLLFFVDAGG